MPLLLLLLINNFLGASAFDSKVKCLKKIICSNYYINEQGQPVPTNQVRLDNHLLSNCEAFSNSFKVKVFKNNLTLSLPDRPSILLNCNRDEEPEKIDCDTKKTSVETIVKTSSELYVPYYQKKENGVINHKCSNRDEIYIDVKYIKKNRRESLINNLAGFQLREIKEETHSCISCNDYHKIIGVEASDENYFVRNGDENMCINMHGGCLEGQHRVRIKKDKTNDSQDKYVGFVGGPISNNVGSTVSYSPETRCVEKCPSGQINNAIGGCVFESCQKIYDSAMSQIEKNKALPSKIGKCDSMTIQSLWADYKRKYQKMAQKNKEACLSYSDETFIPMHYSMINFATVVLPVCEVSKETLINDLPEDVIENISFMPDGFHQDNQPETLIDYYGQNLLEIYDDISGPSLKNNNNIPLLESSKSSPGKIEGGGGFGWPSPSNNQNAD
ncbi:MAG: hypothetical protein MK008_07445 [Bdellovibrionales bacterium]|nr:hypothetical protein [Bdellovibrionales bacterium]